MKRTAILFLCMGLLCASPLQPLLGQGRMAVTMKAGTLGGELGVARSLSPRLTLRSGFNFFSFGLDGETEGDDPLAYEMDLNYFSIPLMLDVALGGGFRFTAGALFHTNIIEGTGQALNTYTFDEDEFTPEEIGALTVKVEPGLKLMPYLGLGLGHSATGASRLGFLFDIGIFYQGAPKVTLEANEESMIFPTTKQEADIEEDIKNLKWYPYIALGFAIRL